ncbi:hypothetical protein B0H63DRAFT_538176 [Podospora didyma]|uniref:Azaphilone pigments biosynthesis cluster protein L N-terminal domain-containing protein n=1 Tax=Podospora didyma TaxID=330526 RepID=A0AAE0NYL7_9PEZI|nr:hypothetical protein B0H63DRAFT_538176 [Podospora didyma]
MFFQFPNDDKTPHTSVAVIEFSRDARHAASDLDALSAELQALSRLLNPLAQSISNAAASTIPSALVAQVNTALAGCEKVVEKIDENIQKYRRNRVFSQAAWALFGQADTNKLRTSLEQYNLALRLGMHAIATTLGASIKDDTAVIREYVAGIELNKKDILARVNSIRRTARFPSNPREKKIEDCIEDMATLSSYAETTYQGTILESTKIVPYPESLPPILEGGDAQPAWSARTELDHFDVTHSPDRRRIRLSDHLPSYFPVTILSRLVNLIPSYSTHNTFASPIEPLLHHAEGLVSGVPVTQNQRHPNKIP